MCAYFSESEDESLEAMKQAAKEASISNLNASNEINFKSICY